MSRSVDTIWIVLTPLAGVGLCCVLVARKYTLKRNVVREGDQRPGSSGSDSQKATSEAVTTDSPGESVTKSVDSPASESQQSAEKLGSENNSAEKSEKQASGEAVEQK
jgi:hypothetical protein